MSERLRAEQSLPASAPVDREANSGKNSKNKLNKYAVAFGAIALPLVAVACGNGRVENSKNPTVDSSPVATRSVEPTAVENSGCMELTQDIFDAQRKINGQNWWDLLSKQDPTGNTKWQEVFEPVKYDDQGHQRNYLMRFLNSHGTVGVYAERIDKETGKIEEARDKESLFGLLFENGQIKPGQEIEVAIYSELTDPTAVSKIGVEGQPGYKIYEITPTNNADISIRLGKVDPYHPQTAQAGELEVNALTTADPNHDDKFQISSTQVENLGQVYEGQCIERPNI